MSLPSQEGASLELAQGALQQGRFEDAIRHASALTAADNSNFGAWQILGIAYANTGNNPGAVDALSQATRLQPTAASAHYNLAQAMIAAGNSDGARGELQTCLSLDPGYSKAQDALQNLNPYGDYPASPFGVPAQPAAVPTASFGVPAQPAAVPTATWSTPMTPGSGPVNAYGQGAPSYGAGGFGQPMGQEQTQPYGQAIPGQSGTVGGYPSSATLIGQGVGGYGAPAGLLSATKGWAISGIVLGAICLCMYGVMGLGAIAVEQLRSTALPPIFMFDALIALLFIIGAAGTLARKSWGRTLLMGSAIAASMMLCVDLFMTFTGAGMPDTSAALSGRSQSYQTGYQIGVHFGALFGDLGKICYCILLFLHLKSDRVKDTMIG